MTSPQAAIPDISQAGVFARTVWDKFSVIDVSPVVEAKGGLDYISWSNVWTDIKRIYPESTFIRLEDTEYPDRTVDVWIRLSIREGVHELRELMWLPVMDNRNNAIENPSSRQRSDSAVRCMVKCAALFGYGLSLWRGTELSDSSDFTETIAMEEQLHLSELIKVSGSDRKAFLRAAGVVDLALIPASRYGTLVDQLERRLEG